MDRPLIRFLVSSPLGDVPVDADRLDLPLECDPLKTSYRSYFHAIEAFLKEDKYASILKATSEMLESDVNIQALNEIIVRTEKHGSLYHPASVELLLANKIIDNTSNLSFPQPRTRYGGVGNPSDSPLEKGEKGGCSERFRTDPGQSRDKSRNDRLKTEGRFINDRLYDSSKIKFGLNVAVTDTGRDWLRKEFDVIQRINSKFGLPYLPAIYSFDDRGSAAFLLEEWFEGYHEFHLSSTEDGKYLIKLWEYGKGDRYLSPKQSFEIYRQASKILTLYYDINDFSQIFPWHHAAGDFIARIEDDEIDLRLTTARQYEPYMVFQDNDGLNPILALFFFFLNLTIKMRLDKLDGVGDTVWAEDFCIDATVKGFFEALRMKDNLSEGGADFLDLLKSFGTEDLKAAYQSLIDAYSGTADYPVIVANLDEHIAALQTTLRNFP